MTVVVVGLSLEGNKARDSERETEINTGRKVFLV
jgi:hypothetical protein